MAEKPSVLIIGGLGYIGRFLALHINNNNLASEVRIVDKVLPQLAWLPDEFKEACSSDKFVQADASRDQALEKIFDRGEGKSWDYVFNCGGETRYSQEDEVYRIRSLGLAVALGKEAAKRNVKVFVELSTGMVYKSDSTPSKEGDKLKPWSKIATFKLKAEEELAKIEGQQVGRVWPAYAHVLMFVQFCSLNLVILRLAHVYGPYASQWVATALCIARVYQYLESEMKWLWTKDLRTNTVHINDLTRAMWDVANWYNEGKAKWDPKSMGPTPRLTSLTMTGFQGQLVSTFARLNMDSVVDDVNEELLGPWGVLLEEANITRPGPLTPFMEKELLKDTDLSMDGARLEEVVGFSYEKPELTKELIEEVIESYKKMNWWP
ncbi:unnamed protein product [Parascedosporium putredinis]|uniref:NAD-dependent epimerase/dehydratase domain-containing protein n=1 Tax=Parascedosporium putredinis TaxID=1442378 RepID=A0A9P1H603_9PEZI|nr:unnamed protein product [Parascedosporium putredinis]CAI7997572.1 unnamed protein product [Parascedosporium putredinis]